MRLSAGRILSAILKASFYDLRKAQSSGSRERRTLIEISNHREYELNNEVKYYYIELEKFRKKIVESIDKVGTITPLLARPLPDGGYELISGHRRLEACRKLGLENIPVIVRKMTDDEAVIAMVDANLQREHILPSEKAFAYKMKLEAISHQGKACGQLVHKSRDTVSETDSGRQVQRYIRLTKLIPQLLKMVDEERIAFSVGVELSYLSEYEQQDLLEAIELEDKTPSLSQAIQMKKLSQSGRLDSEIIERIISEDKPNQREKISFQYDELSKYFPKCSPQEVQRRMMKLAQADYQRRVRNRNREAR